MFHERSIKNPGKKSWAQNDIVQSFWLHHTAYTNLTSNDNLGPFCSSFSFRLRNHHVKEETSTFKASQKQQQPTIQNTHNPVTFCFGGVCKKNIKKTTEQRNVTVGTNMFNQQSPLQAAAAASCVTKADGPEDGRPVKPFSRPSTEGTEVTSAWDSREGVHIST